MTHATSSVPGSDSKSGPSVARTTLGWPSRQPAAPLPRRRKGAARTAVSTAVRFLISGPRRRCRVRPMWGAVSDGGAGHEVAADDLAGFDANVGDCGRLAVDRMIGRTPLVSALVDGEDDDGRDGTKAPDGGYRPEDLSQHGATVRRSEHARHGFQD